MYWLFSCTSIFECCIIIFFFKQKTAYEMRISDWSSDVCSSDLQMAKAVDVGEPRQVAQGQRLVGEQRAREQGERRILGARDGDTALQSLAAANDDLIHWPSLADASLRASGAVGQIGSASFRERVCQVV